MPRGLRREIGDVRRAQLPREREDVLRRRAAAVDEDRDQTRGGNRGAAVKNRPTGGPLEEQLAKSLVALGPAERRKVA